MDNRKQFGNLHGMDKQVLKERAPEHVIQADFSETAGRRDDTLVIARFMPN